MAREKITGWVVAAAAAMLLVFVGGVLAQKGPDVLMPFDTLWLSIGPEIATHRLFQYRLSSAPIISTISLIVIEVLISRDDCRLGLVILSIFLLSRFPRTRVAANT